MLHNYSIFLLGDFPPPAPRALQVYCHPSSFLPVTRFTLFYGKPKRKSAPTGSRSLSAQFPPSAGLPVPPLEERPLATPDVEPTVRLTGPSSVPPSGPGARPPLGRLVAAAPVVVQMPVLGRRRLTEVVARRRPRSLPQGDVFHGEELARERLAGAGV